jgi:CBS domain-containing protein
LADGADPDGVWAADVAAEDIMSADPEETVVTAIGIMADNGIRHLPIRDEGEIVGMVSARDLLRAVVDAAHR